MSPFRTQLDLFRSQFHMLLTNQNAEVVAWVLLKM